MSSPGPFVPGLQGRNRAAERAAFFGSTGKITPFEAWTADDIRRLSQETRNLIQALITRAIREGIPPYEAARLIREMIGMNLRQAHAVLNYRESLVNMGLSIADVDRKVKRYEAKQIRRRALMIARTETINSLNEGQISAWNDAEKRDLIDADVKKKVIVAWDERLCDICRGVEALGPIPRKDKFQASTGAKMSPGFHPNCRCSMGLVRPGN